jgi:acyl-coenzyme A thioesterase PaaI-like protein
MTVPERVAQIRAEYDHCFGCGSANPFGLQLDGFEVTGSAVVTTFTPRPEYGGFAGVLHGGIVAAALDEIMAWTAILTENVMVMTGTLELRYRKPAAVAASFTLQGELLERRGRRLKLAGRLLDDSTEVAGAVGVFLAVEDLPGVAG